MKKISKPTIILSSLGRTGTNFLALFFEKHFPEIAAYHEPGVIDIRKKKITNLLNFILKNKFVNFGKNNIRKISNQRLCGIISKKTAANSLKTIRSSFIEKQNQKIYLESSYHYACLLDTLSSVFEKYRVIYIIRDPRDWVRSYMNVGMYHKGKDINYILGNRPHPKKNTQEYLQWKKYSRFEKLCWLWQTANTYALNTLDKRNGKLFLFEDLFINENKIKNFKNLISFSLAVDSQEQQSLPEIEELLKIQLSKKKNIATTYAFPSWEEWTPKEAKQMNNICGKLMHKLNYGKEKTWKKLLK